MFNLKCHVAKSRLNCQKISRLIWSSKIQYCVYRIQLLVDGLSQMSPDQTLLTYFFNIALPSSIILLSTHKSIKWYLLISSEFSDHILYAFAQLPKA